MYKVGDEVSYGLHGKCVVTAIETKELPSGLINFYQIRTIKNPITAKNPNRKDPFILIPVASAQTKGLRPLMTKADAETALKLLADGDYHFEMTETWVSKQKTLEEALRTGGPTGLAKVVGHLYVMIKRDAVPASDVVRFFENVYKILARELADSLGVTTKDVEPIMTKALKNKLSYDN